MQTDKYNIFDKINLPYHYNSNIKEAKQNYGIITPITFEADYTDPLLLIFQIDPKYNTYKIQFTLFNFRLEQIFSHNYICDGHSQIHVDLDSTFTTRLLKKGNYYCQLRAIHYIDDNIIDSCILIAANDCTIFIR